MSRVINSPQTGSKSFLPLVGIREIGNYVKGRVLEIGQTVNKNPVVTFELIDLEGSTSRSIAKGQYEEVEVAIGDKVQMVGSSKQLQDKIPQLIIGDVATITFEGKTKLKSGRSMNNFKVEVE